MWVIDGYNVIFARRDPGEKMEPRELERERDSLVSLLHRFLAARGGRATLVFDGTRGHGLPREPRRPNDRVEVMYSSPGTRADDTIIGLVMHSKNAGAVTVVTGDLEIVREVTKLGANCVDSADFLRQTEAALRNARGRAEDEPIEKSRGISASEVDYWMKMFGNPKDPEEEER